MATEAHQQAKFKFSNIATFFLSDLFHTLLFVSYLLLVIVDIIVLNCQQFSDEALSLLLLVFIAVKCLILLCLIYATESYNKKRKTIKKKKKA